MDLPRVNPVGIVEQPEGYEATPRTYPVWLRVLAMLFVTFFLAVTVVTGTLSLGAYCLTSNGADTRELGRP